MAKNNFQGSNVNIENLFYSHTFPYIKENDAVLNLGCGLNFNFEKALLKKKKVHITCIDIIASINKPKFIDEYIVQSVENKFKFKKKFDVITFFELIEHIDKTDVLLKNCFDNLKKGGYFICSVPNLASIYCRIELLFGLQPHILEVSNEQGNFGSGIFGRLNNPSKDSIHHIRGLTYRAMRELLIYHHFKIEKVIGASVTPIKIFSYFPALSPGNIYICKKLHNN